MPQSMSPLLIASFVVAIAVDIGLPIAIAIWVKRRFGIGWKVFLQGGAGLLLVPAGHPYPRHEGNRVPHGRRP